ncbi:MAG: DUF2905 domain-containing protein [Candidatus Omnitrophica bacterium]|nr:DUF2905 domain-containing protein [Candidatus Omnitrophota bacterium]
MIQIGRMLILFGIAVVAIGLLLMVFGKVPFIGKLPGDIVIQRRNLTFYFPLATCFLISVVLSLVAWFWSRR